MAEQGTTSLVNAGIAARKRAARNAAALRRIDRIFARADRGLRVPEEAREQAWERALVFLEARSRERAGGHAPEFVFATEMLASIAVDLAARPGRLRELIEQLEDALKAPRVALGRELLRLPQLLQLPTAVAIEVQLALLRGLTNARSTSLWTIEAGQAANDMACAGALGARSDQLAALATKMLIERSPGALHRGAVGAMLIERWQEPTAVLICSSRGTLTPEQSALLHASASMFTVMLERADLRARGAGAEAQALASAERRLARLRFDLHDGPQQDVLLLNEDLELFRDQLGTALENHPHRERVLGRLADLKARLVVLDGDLRRISVSVESPLLHAEPLPDAINHLAADFTSRTGIEPAVQFSGSFSGLTDSQQIALLGLIREALSNVREHSDATVVEIAVTAGARGIEATVSDDGRGFDPESTLMRAARDGHLGLVGMHERVRLLGGRTRIDSRPGGPTVVSISLPPVRMDQRSAPRRRSGNRRRSPARRAAS